ncbi:PREDICTED: uncharacterized protein LOC109241780 isoform X2 [Nicotiana attenuata]|nr:PREDICTED: uncharacterized protein LOC109241780 isoform X2 [Nicotiana attenuata]
MPTDKKTIAPSWLFQKRKRQYSAERASKIKLRRHDVYANQSADKKEMLLAQRRSKNIESTSQGLLVEHTEVASSSETATELSGQRILKIEESCCLPEKGSIAGPVAGCDKGKNITDHFSVLNMAPALVYPMNNIMQIHLSSQTKLACRGGRGELEAFGSEERSNTGRNVQELPVVDRAHQSLLPGSFFTGSWYLLVSCLLLFTLHTFLRILASIMCVVYAIAI